MVKNKLDLVEYEGDPEPILALLGWYGASIDSNYEHEKLVYLPRSSAESGYYWGRLYIPR